ncbi:FHA domain-containing protein [Streptomyces parvus]|uniref:FHA domain-containing protein n=1 Tax=Streptomyces parvus TaxID=66428 RepID=UPI0036308B06
MGYHVGRDPESDIVIDDDRVSWHHAILHPEDGHWTIEDEDSTNGTYTAGRRIHASDVGAGSEIRFGNPSGGPRAVLLGREPPAPVAQEDPRQTGRAWPGYRASEVVVVEPSEKPVKEFVMVDPENGDWFKRPAGDTGDGDKKTDPPKDASESPCPPGSDSCPTSPGDTTSEPAPDDPASRPGEDPATSEPPPDDPATSEPPPDDPGTEPAPEDPPGSPDSQSAPQPPAPDTGAPQDPGAGTGQPGTPALG